MLKQKRIVSTNRLVVVVHRGFSATTPIRKTELSMLVVAQKRFELLSKAPEASMLDHYTTGLRKHRETSLGFINFNVGFYGLSGFLSQKKDK
jgi:hypothetical protein